MSVDGIGFVPVEFTIDADIHAVQWYGTHGEIEYKTEGKHNERFTDPSLFQVAIDAYIEAIKPVPPVEPTLEERLIAIRTKRNQLLTECDWTQLPDAPLTTEQKQSWAAYRQQLRDFPSTCDPYNPVWPTKPQ